VKTHSINQARAHLSELVDSALAGEPQRVTRYGKEAVVIVSEQAWRARPRSAPALGALRKSGHDPRGQRRPALVRAPARL